ncbi:MAG: hypothetical protein HY912_23650 [Desulfomonile tiedjei]|uniref:Uncharacterized protein n=1 Tax=Desulfomonile tiedjei TaxID=2358 RepID=A0A9D6V5J1_9BACT|nr:hypothetical protein [Desulfomonile tiedjei]
MPPLRAKEAMLLMGALAYGLLHMLQQFCLVGKDVKRSERKSRIAAMVACPCGVGVSFGPVRSSCVRVARTLEKWLTEWRRV